MGVVLEILLEIRCHRLPGARVGERTEVRLGVQKQRDVVDDIVAEGEEARFTVPIRIAFKPTGAAQFQGAFVHGTPRERFVYLCWGERREGVWEGFSRTKLQLLPIPTELLFRASDTNTPLVVSVDMTDARGRILTGTLKEPYLYLAYLLE